MSGRAMIAIELITTPTADVRALVSELEATLAAEYPPEQRHGLPLEAIFQPHIRFFVVRADGVAVGCGAVTAANRYQYPDSNCPHRLPGKSNSSSTGAATG